MGDIKYQFDGLSTRDGFNKSLRHFKLVNELVEDFAEYYNLADLLNDLLTEKKIVQSQIKPIINALLIDKYKYKYSSYNFEETITEFKTITETKPVADPDLSKVDEIGFTDLMAGGRSDACSRVDWIEVYGKPVKR